MAYIRASAVMYDWLCFLAVALKPEGRYRDPLYLSWTGGRCLLNGYNSLPQTVHKDLEHSGYYNSSFFSLFILVECTSFLGMSWRSEVCPLVGKEEEEAGRWFEDARSEFPAYLFFVKHGQVQHIIATGPKRLPCDITLASYRKGTISRMRLCLWMVFRTAAIATSLRQMKVRHVVMILMNRNM